MNSAKKAGLVIVAAGMAFGASAGVASAYGYGDDHGFQGAGANGAAAQSPGVLSGNVIQIPVDVPVNLCGNTYDIPGVLNPAFGNTCVNF